MKRAARIAYLCSDPGIALNGKKGASVHLRLLAEAMQRADLNLDVFLARQDPESRPSAKVTVVAPEQAQGVEMELELISNSTAMHAAMHGRGPHAAVYERFSLFGIAGLAYARSIDIPHILEVNAPLWEEARRYRRLILAEHAQALARETLIAATKVLVVSEELARIVADEGVPHERIEVFSNAVDRTTFATAVPAALPEALRAKRNLIFVGSLKPWHGIEFLLEAFQRCARDLNLGLWIIGDGPLAEDVRRAAASEPERMVYQGHIPHEQIPGALLAADVVVVPYPRDAPAYFSPLKLIEAQAAGRPILASEHPAVTAALLPGAQAELYPAGDAHAFVASLKRLLGSGQKSMAVQVPSWDDHALRISEIIGNARSSGLGELQRS